MPSPRLLHRIGPGPIDRPTDELAAWVRGAPRAVQRAPDRFALTRSGTCYGE
ncbi:hypothetical protein [Dactylosporangium matsuzakiense]|uniref:Uncharacterized protein n=1 Tax=Dactylosporangium matsuzakiense TaxID=53360 RepID=A0A9W6KK25_9ACTN|nr:hypothetical protein [Dactylosporangium matsuzakiense]GLL02280.1 hypothetical protein GCM10017581_040220 [Dactylosporangium matsuzakiense]